MKNDEIREAMQFLNSSWPQKPLEGATVRIWGQQFVPYENADVMRVLLGLARSSKWRPSLAEILELLEPDTSEQASAAFGSLRLAFIAPPGQRDAAVTSRTAETVRRLGGWSIVGQWKRENYGIHQREFERVYNEINPDKLSQGTALPGAVLRALEGGA